jgi:hypothetical protein
MIPPKDKSGGGNRLKQNIYALAFALAMKGELLVFNINNDL